LKDELLLRTCQYRGKIKIYEEKLRKLEENQDSFLKTAQKRYEDLVWGKEDFIYDIKVIDFQMKDLERELHHPQETSKFITNANNDQETTSRGSSGDSSAITLRDID